MLNLLLRHKPKETTEEKFKEEWEHLATALEPLYKSIQELVPSEKLSLDDMSNPNLYAKMVWIQAQKDFASKILSLFPKGLDKQ